MNWFKKLFHKHDWTEKHGTGIYQKGYRELVRVPVTQRVCKICNKTKTTLRSLSRRQAHK